MNQEMRDAATRGARDTAAGLIREGVRLFAREGYDGASVRQITRAAGANLGAITYHFGSKRGLYEAVLAHALDPVRRRVEEGAAVGGASLDRIEGALRAMFECLYERPEIPQLMLRETAAGRRPRGDELRPVQRVLELLAGVIAEGQVAGEIRSGDPLLMAVSTVAQPVHLTLVGRIALPPELGPDRPAGRARLLEHAIRTVRASLANDGGGE